MNKIFHKKIFFLIIPLLILMIVSLLDMKIAGDFSTRYDNYLFKQIVWYALGFIIFFGLQFVNINRIIKYAPYLYILGNILLLLVLLFGKQINGARAWFSFGYFTFQPSELMKLILILYLSVFLTNVKVKPTMKSELQLIAKVFLIVLIPVVLTFLEPDTGAVIIFFIIGTVMLFFSNIRIRWFIYFFLLIVIFVCLFMFLYFKQQNFFIDIFGTNFFYRMDRIIDFKNQSGLQLENALIAIGSSGFFGRSLLKASLYFPEAPTDFIFALTLSSLGFVLGLLVLICFLLMNLYIVHTIYKEKNKVYKLFLFGFLGMFLFQQIQNIMMNIGLLPIMGIALPFLSYGGTSIIVYFISIAFICKIITLQQGINKIV